MKPQAFFHAFNGQEAQIRFIPILRQHVGDANPRSLKDVGQEYGDFFPWLPVHIFFLLSMYLLIMFTLADALYILYCFILCFSYICTFHTIWSLTFLSFSFTFSPFIQIHLCWAAAFQWRLVPTPTWQIRKAARRHRWPENEHLPGFDCEHFCRFLSLGDKIVLSARSDGDLNRSRMETSGI